jgi:hypothetical protein
MQRILKSRLKCHLCAGAAMALFISSVGGFAQTAAPAPNDAGASEPVSVYTVQTGTRIPLGLINSVSTKHSVAGDRIYLETVFPIVISRPAVMLPGR